MPYNTERARADGYSVPFPPDTTIRQITLGKDTEFLRFFTGRNQYGGFLIRAKDIQAIMDDPRSLQTYLGLKESPTSYVTVNVPAGTSLNVGRIAPQPNFGLYTNSGFQYNAFVRLPESSFGKPELIIQKNVKVNEEYISSFTK